jgi:hypothetical protein
VIHHHKKREREVEHVTVLKTTTQMRTKKKEKEKRETMLNVYELTIFTLLCSKKEIIDQRTLVLASLSKNKYIERKNEKEEGYTYSPVTQCRCQEREKKKKKTLLMNYYALSE